MFRKFDKKQTVDLFKFCVKQFKKPTQQATQLLQRSVNLPQVTTGSFNLSANKEVLSCNTEILSRFKNFWTCYTALAKPNKLSYLRMWYGQLDNNARFKSAAVSSYMTSGFSRYVLCRSKFYVHEPYNAFLVTRQGYYTRGLNFAWTGLRARTLQRVLTSFKRALKLTPILAKKYSKLIHFNLDPVRGYRPVVTRVRFKYLRKDIRIRSLGLVKKNNITFIAGSDVEPFLELGCSKNRYGLVLPNKTYRASTKILKQTGIAVQKQPIAKFRKPLKTPKLVKHKAISRRRASRAFSTSATDLVVNSINVLEDPRVKYTTLGLPIKKPIKTAFSQHTRDLGLEYYTAKIKRQTLLKRRFQLPSALNVLWETLIKRSVYYSSTKRVSPLAIRKAKTLESHGYNSRSLYANCITHSINILYFQSIRFTPKRLTRSKRARRHLHSMYTAQIPLYYDSSILTLQVNQPWMTIYSRFRTKDFDPVVKQRRILQILMVVEPYYNRIYFVDLRSIVQVNFSLISLNSRSPFLISSSASQVYKLWYDRRRVTVCFFSFVSLVGGKSSTLATPSRDYKFSAIGPEKQLVVSKPVSNHLRFGLRVSHYRLLRPFRTSYFLYKAVGIRSASQLDLLKLSFNKHRARLQVLLNYEYRSFRWKFFNKRWYFLHSQWKKSIIFRTTLNTVVKGYRKIYKDFLFIKLFKIHLAQMVGLSPSTLWDSWKQIRHGSQNNSLLDLVKQFSIALSLKLDNLLLMLGLAPNRAMAQELVLCGGLRVNGFVCTNYNYTLTIGDSLQLEFQVRHNLMALYTESHWAAIKIRVNFIRYLQPLWSLFFFKLIRQPLIHEVVEESMLSIRWLRYYIRYFPIQISKYKHF